MYVCWYMVEMAQSVSAATWTLRKLSLSDLKTVRDALYEARSKWEDIGIELGLGKNDTDAIKREKSNNVGDCFREMLSTYLKRDNPEPSWSSIIAALRARAVGESQLAQDLVQSCCSSIISRKQTVAVSEHQCTDGEASQQYQEDNIHFPYLDTSNLSPDEKQDLIQKLSRDYTEILDKFATLEAGISESFDKRNISAEKIANCALRLALNKSDNVPRPLLPDELGSLEEAKSIDRIFFLLKKHHLISYFDYGILKHIIEIHGTENDKCKLKDYVDDFQKFCQRRVFEVPPVISECTSSTRKIFQVLMTADMKKTLIDIAAAERKIADIIDVAHSVLMLHEITPGSLILTLSIPTLIADKLFPLQKEQLDQLIANGFSILSEKTHPKNVEQPSMTLYNNYAINGESRNCGSSYN